MKNWRVMCGGAALVVALLWGGCTLGENNTPRERESADFGTARVTLDVPRTAARSVADGPSLTLLPERTGWLYTLTFENEDGTYSHAEESITAGTSKAVSLEAGAWTITGHAKKSGTELAVGSVTIVVTASQTVTAPISLGPVTGEGFTGVFSYKVTLPAGVTGTFTLKRSEDWYWYGSDETTALDEGDNSGARSLETGTYLLTVAVSGPDGADGVVEAVHIYRGQQTSFTWAPETVVRTSMDASDYDLSSLVPAPVTGAAVAPASIDAAHYTGVVTWKTPGGQAAAGEFAPGVAYTAEVTLTAKDGYTFTGAAANAFSHSGAASVTNPANSGLVTIAFPATAGSMPTGSAAVTIGFNETIEITGSDGTNLLYKSGTPERFSLTASADYTDIEWYVDAARITSGLSNNYRTVLVRAVDYAVGSHTITFVGTVDGRLYSQHIPLTIEAGSGGADGVTVEGLAAYLADLPANTASTPHTVPLAASVTIDTQDTSAAGVWATINSAVKSARKYVTLDLSLCAAAGDIISSGVYGYDDAGNWYDNSANRMNIIQNNAYVKGVILPTLNSIGNEAFSGCAALTSVTIQDGLSSISDSAFSGCTSLISVIIPAGVTSIGGSAFSGCTGLTSVVIPAGVTSIADNVFNGCSNLAGVTIPDSVTSIGGAVFNGCSSLTSVVIPAGVTSISYFTFGGCSSLTSVTIPDSVTSISEYAFAYCSSLTTVVIPAGVTSISGYAFQSCSSLTSVTIPEGVSSIGYSAFESCSSLTSVTISEGVSSIGSSAFSGCSLLTSVTIPGTVASIGSGAFSGCSLTSVTIPDGVTSIGYGAFSGCNVLTSVTFAAGSDIISGNFGSSAFPEGSYGFGGDTLKAVYVAASPTACTYTRPVNGSVWTKQ